MKKEFRVYLRELQPADAEVSYHWRQNDDIWKSMVGPRYYVSRAYERYWVQNIISSSPDQRVWAICLKETDELLGFVYMTHIDRENRCASSGKMIGVQAAWSKGYGTEGSLLSLYEGFMKMGLERIETRQMVWNMGARKSSEKMGFQCEGILRRVAYKDGQYQDMTVYGLMKEDFLPWLNIYQFPHEAGELV